LKDILAKFLHVQYFLNQILLEQNIHNEYYNLTNHSNLRADIEKCGEGAFYNGFNTVWKKGHSKMTVQEAKHAIYGDRIDNAGSEKSKKVLGQISGGVASIGEGMAIGAGLSTVAWGLINIGSLLCTGKPILGLKGLGNLARVGAGVGAITNLGWKFI
jgi:hypothetical protein